MVCGCDVTIIAAVVRPELILELETKVIRRYPKISQSTYRRLTPIQHSVLNVKVLVGAFNQEKALVGAISVIVEPMDRFTALFYCLQFVVSVSIF